LGVTLTIRPAVKIGVKEEASNKSIQASLAPLIVKGLIKLPSREINKRNLSPIQVPGKPVSEMVLEDRG